MRESVGKSEQKPLTAPLRPIDGEASLVLGGSRPTPDPETGKLRRWVGEVGAVTIEVD